MLPAERAILGACLIDGSIFGSVVEALRADHFGPDARLVFVTIRELYERGRSIDAISVKGSLPEAERGAIDALIDDLPYPTDSAVEGWVEAVKEAGRRRRLAQEIAKLDSMALDPALDSQRLLAFLRSLAFGFDSVAQDGTSFDPLALSRLGIRTVEELVASQGRPTGIPTGFKRLDEMTGGFRAGQYIAIGSRPSVGKSSLSLQIADHAANEGHVVAFFSLEMEAAELAVVRACGEAEISRYALQWGHEQHMARMAEVFGRQSKTPLYVEKLYAPSLGPIRARAARIKTKHGLGLIVVDYLQLMRSEGKFRSNRNEEITEISSGLKAMAGDLGVPVIVCAQLNRQAANADNEKPRLSHFRDSGSIEADCDVALLLHRVNADADRSFPVAVNIMVEKNRVGPCGTVTLIFTGKHQRFSEEAEEEPE